MASTDRQNRLLVAEDWKRIYQSYTSAEFQSYDFDSLRRVMINYLRENYPEDFNDYIESSEYIALIDLIAFLGQNLSFRIDLNARENFLELAERRESILRLARLLSYSAKRNICANGLLKITSVRTTESIIDSNNLNLQGQNIIWNDPSNNNWYEQYIRVLNAAFDVNNKFGQPYKKDTINNLLTERYRINSSQTGLPIFNFAKSIDGQTVRFEIVPVDFSNDIVEKAPLPGDKFSLLYREDGIGPASNNTGFFVMFKQGTLDQGNFTVESPNANQIVTIDSININNDDVWLYSLNADTSINELWTKVDAIEGNNIIYNDVGKGIRNIYSVLTRVNDRISLIFSDGTFGALPQGNFRVYYRTSRNSNLVINPRDMLGIGISIDYTSTSQKIETLNLVLELQYTVDNASIAESNDSIKQRAPMNYYTQNRLITAEDYQIGPLLASTKIVKTKSINRLSSGISRYIDLKDATGKYSKTNLFATDGILYKEIFTKKFNFTFETDLDIEKVLLNQVNPLLNALQTKNYYFHVVAAIPYVDQGLTWVDVYNDVNYFTGYLQNTNNIRQVLGTFTQSILKFIRPNSLLKFVPPNGMHFDPDGNLKIGEADYKNSTKYKWVKCIKFENNGTNELDNGHGPVLLNDFIPTGAVLAEIRPFVSQVLTDDVKKEIVSLILAYQTFGLRFDRGTARWEIVKEENLNVVDNYNEGKAGDITGQKLDSTWIIKFTTSKEIYDVEHRAARYIFESENEVNFYFDESDKIYDNRTGKIIKDKISVLSINTLPFYNDQQGTENFTQDFNWQITESYRDELGYVTSDKVAVEFFDSDDDGISDDESMFEEIVNPSYNNGLNSFVFQEKYLSVNGVERYKHFPNNNNEIIVLQTKNNVGPLSQYDNNQIFYYIDTNIFQKFNKNLNLLDTIVDYKAFLGRNNLKFQYEHAADQSARIDPSQTNIIDVYVLTSDYDTQFRKYLNDTITTKPLPLSSDQLYVSYGTQLNSIKSITDELIYHPAKYRIIFGSKADETLQVIFKVIKNPDLVLNDNEVKSRIVTYINQFFSLTNWDFGETFYFSELSAYIIKEMAPDITTLLIVPVQSEQVYGSLYQIKCEDDELLISGATVSDIEIIDEISADKIKATGAVVISSYSANTGIQSS
jgi:hypothetical protein